MRLALLSLAAVALLVSACGDDDSSSTAASTETVTEETAAAEETTAETTPTAPDGGIPPATQTVTTLSGFTSPTGNVGCLIDPETVRCDIADRQWEPPPAPPDCKLDYGEGITLGAGSEPELTCAGDTALGAGEPIPYGTSIAAGLLRCESERTGITCTDVESGRGFTLSEQAYELF